MGLTGKVTFFNVVKSVGFAEAEVVEGGKRLKRKFFVHSSSIKTDDEFRALLPKDEVEFEPMPDDQGRWQAARVRVINRPGPAIITNPNAESPFMISRIASLIVNDGALELLGKGNSVAVPAVEAKGHFRAYRMEEVYVSDFALELPDSTKDEAVVLLDPDKHPRRSVEREEGKLDIGNFYINITKGSYLLYVKRSGSVVVECVGNVYYRDTKVNYLVIQRRFSHKYGDFTEEQLRKTPTSGLDRDNDGFIRGILRGVQMMDEAAAESAVQVQASTTP